ncbi:fructose-1,6-bisphosphatase [Clostridium grantii]|uniref:Fructose-1,6-bisphosphatase class 3 n=1 Tax=Clostridium grantii DSM 8605 TaxID=1121316 RepID=A0A1M5RNJ4_9CLOT|nr:fructose-1,6-bisphosphatase [Clostridium grantii]SHH27648.1 fructose-1,6-bisphosphatase-3 [Clostridium grantii DSM 8605]
MTYFDEKNLEAIISDLRYLELLSSKYPSISAASTEIINLQAILNLPQSTEHFISDIHGEYESFTHMLKNASGVIKRKINEVFGNSLRESEKKTLITLIYYPEEKLSLIKENENEISDWYKITLHRLIDICRIVSSKYTRSKVRKALPTDFAYIIEELLHERDEKMDKQKYYNGIIDTIIDIDRADEFIIAIASVIKRLVVERLHIVGDIYDRGPGAEIIVEELMNHHSVDIQWGNHDLLWMAAAAGNLSCIANVLRNSLRYGNLRTLEDGYGINLLPLATFAMEIYDEDSCTNYIPHNPTKKFTKKEKKLLSKMHKAITIIQFKLEGQIIKNHPEFNMDDRLLLDKIDLEKSTVLLNNMEYPIKDNFLPTLNKDNPYELTIEEELLIKKLKHSFLNSEKLQRHIRFLYSKGSMYLIHNSNLLFHGCIPLNEDGSFKKVIIDGDYYKGKDLLEKYDSIAREAYFFKDDIVSQHKAMDLIWYLWCGTDSPQFGKDKMTTFERYFIADTKTHHEKLGLYYTYRNEESFAKRLLSEFNLNPDKSHIINGHVPVKSIDGESAIKAGGRLLAIDGGFCKAYQPETGIAGYTLVHNSYGLLLISHEPFDSIQKAIHEDKDIISSAIILERTPMRKRVMDTDKGKELQKSIKEIEMLLIAYRNGLIKEPGALKNN